MLLIELAKRFKSLVRKIGRSCLRLHKCIFLDSVPNIDEASQRSIDGILGVIHLISGPYLIVITSKLRIGNIHGHAIYKIQSTELVSYARSTSLLNEHQVCFCLSMRRTDECFVII